MTLSQLVLYPLTHRMVTEGQAQRLDGFEAAYANALANERKALPAPTKAKRVQRKPKVQS